MKKVSFLARATPPPSRFSRSRPASLVAIGVSLAAPASAALGVACPDPATQTFKAWNDPASYAFLPNGGFEQGTTAGRSRAARGSSPGTSRTLNHSRGRATLARAPGGKQRRRPRCASAC